MRVRIFQPAKTATQSGRAKTHQWKIEPELTTPRAPESLMGWTRADDTFTELRDRLFFATAEEAVAFATREGWEYTVQPPHARTVTPRNYLDNFKPNKQPVPPAKSKSGTAQ